MFVQPTHVIIVADVLMACGLSALAHGEELSAAANTHFRNPYGVVTDATRSEYEMHEDVLDMVRCGGMGYMRVDWDWRVCQPASGAAFDFSKYDRLVAAAEKCGVTILPIIYGTPKWADPAWQHIDEYASFVSATVSHYGMRIPVIEIWNEQNIPSFWRDPDPKRYVQLLRAVYKAAKAANPNVRVAMGGLAGWALPFLESLYKEGLKDCCDIVNVHPYAYPNAPEQSFQREFAKLRELMAKEGDSGKPVWFTEVGWPTHDINITGPGNFVPAALKVARPEKKVWNVLYAACVPDDQPPDQTMAGTLEEQLPIGSKVRVETPKGTVRQLSEGNWDAVIYPPDESYPADTIEAVYAFVRDGGTLIDLGGMPLWNPYSNGVKHKFDEEWSRFERFHIGLDSFWLPGSELPKGDERLKVYATDAGLAAGVKQEPTGFACGHFFTAKALKENDQMVPLVSGCNPQNGKEIVSVCVYLLDSELKGRVVVGGISGQGFGFRVTETMQAQNTVRAMAISFAEGLEAYFTYCLRAYERDRFYSEDHFGIIHANLVPKPAWLAVKNFSQMRPAGSSSYQDAWWTGILCRTEWRRPDGIDAGMVWRPRRPVTTELSFPDNVQMRFYDMWGKPSIVRNLGGGRFSLGVGDEPVYYLGARLVGHRIVNQASR